MKQIILVQHCQSEHHINNLSGGWTDSALTSLGKEQAKKTGLKLQTIIDEKDDYLIYSSDLLRASQTANIMGEELNITVTIERGLREINTGVAIGKTKEWEKNHRNPLKDNKFSMDYRPFDKGESWGEFYKRVSHTMNALLKKDGEKKIIIVTHGGTLGYIVAWWLKLTPEILDSAYFQSDVGGITILIKNDFGQSAVTKFNDTSHLIE